MPEYISREAAIEALVGLTIYSNAPTLNAAVESAYHNGREWIGGVRDALIEIGDLPAADVVKVRYGRWEQVEILHVEDLNEEDKNCILIASMFCPECKRYHNEVYLYGSPTEMVRYCPNCGAKMDGGQDGTA